jgi:hypothetical protein
MRNLMLLASLLALTACFDTKRLAPAQFPMYWELDTSPPLKMVTFHGPVNACVVVAFTVNSSGKPRRLSATYASQTDGPFIEAAIDHVRSQRFKPSAMNIARTPVKTRKIVSWRWGSMLKDDTILSQCALQLCVQADC